MVLSSSKKEEEATAFAWIEAVAISDGRYPLADEPSHIPDP